MKRWLSFAGAGALVGVAAFVFLLKRDVALAPVFLAAGGVVAAVEILLSRRSAARRSRWTHGVLVLVLVSATAMGAFALLYATLVAP
ncbi:MAG TPA: hypothetical protein VF483_10695 [Gemmatimonadaceae bacterium]